MFELDRDGFAGVEQHLVVGTDRLVLVKAHLRTTLTELIRDRLMRHAKWEMLHTTKPVKQVAAELGFDDVFYFSRLFKRATGVPPTAFREYETRIRGGRNLSIR